MSHRKPENHLHLPQNAMINRSHQLESAGVGSDFSGTIIQLGEGVSLETYGVKVGDRVAGAAHASNRLEPQGGAFAEYIAVCADQIWRVPDEMAFPQAAAIGLSGFRVITTCSPANFTLVESYGAEKAFDYHSPTVMESIRAYTNNSLSAKSLRQCYASIGRAGGRYVGFELVPDELTEIRKAVQASWVLGIRMFGTEIALDGGYGSPANPELRVWGCELFKRLEKLIWEGKIRPHPVELDDKSVVTAEHSVRHNSFASPQIVLDLSRRVCVVVRRPNGVVYGVAVLIAIDLCSKAPIPVLHGRTGGGHSAELVIWRKQPKEMLNGVERRFYRIGTRGARVVGGWKL
uniref:ChaC n=1 Tax=Chaetomium olivaceum TaxID=1087732 RepID=A0A6M6CAT9_9PEZI|nr:ChaC [Chaetomium olivaceum]